MQKLNNPTLKTLVEARTPPCVSIYLPTHRSHPGTAEDPIEFKNALAEVEKELSGRAGFNPEGMLADLHALVGRPEFWSHSLDTLAVFKSPEVDLTIRLPRPYPRTVEVADSFHVKPLIRHYQSAGRYQVLCLTQSRVVLMEGDVDSLEPVPLHDMVPTTLTEALGSEVTGGNVTGSGPAPGPGGGGGGTVGNQGANASTASTPGGARGGIYFGHHDNRDERDIDLERYFRAVDKAIWEHHSRLNHLPLYLATTSDYHDRFEKVSHNKQLQPERLKVDAGLIRTEDVHKRVRPVVQQRYDAEVAELVEAFGTAKAQKKGSGDLNEVAVAALDGRVMMLLIDADKTVGGKLDRLNRRAARFDRADPNVDDLLDDVAEEVLRTGGNVMVLPADKMPTDTGAAAMYRF